MTAPAFSFYAKDWMAATLSWSLEARGAYVTLLAYQWDAGGIPCGFEPLSRILGVSRVKARTLWEVIGPKFEHSTVHGWRNTRLELERVKQADRRAGLSSNGAKGGRPPKAKANQNESYRFPEPKADDNQNESLSSSSSGISEDGNTPPNPPVPGGVRIRREHKAQAREIWRSRLGYCEHSPACLNQVQCTDRIALELAQKGGAS